MNWSVLIPLTIGAVGILQGSLNSKMSGQIGLAQSILLGNVIIVFISIAFYLWARQSPTTFPEFVQVKASLFTWKWWYIFPAIFGMTVVTGLPFAIFQLGAVKVTVFLIAAQMVASVLWDLGVEKMPMTTMKSLGMFFAALSVFFTVR